MVANKDRLYIMPNARGGPGYHWALTQSPKTEDQDSLDETVRYDVRNIPGPVEVVVWEYKFRQTRSVPTHNSFGPVVYGQRFCPTKVDRMGAIPEDVEVIQGHPGWTCNSCVKDAVLYRRFGTSRAGIIG